eukprot:CAMPEP_0194500000 /NCGR_PEP_ID=MMETSP0253-20130528/16125_1 /TAXON_ID=2966 /ORGANISM="Noctiluca scintillans" /LENGTH=59 /DNA_ID=CAMNT_0039341811 /DNA_START=57 /DNA_END=233 /DNA_ORIENTATION=+
MVAQKRPASSLNENPVSKKMCADRVADPGGDEVNGVDVSAMEADDSGVVEALVSTLTDP